jgi:hypothetical protein
MSTPVDHLNDYRLWLVVVGMIVGLGSHRVFAQANNDLVTLLLSFIVHISEDILSLRQSHLRTG